MAKTWTIRNETDLHRFYEEVAKYTPPLVIKLEHGEAHLRSLDQNALLHVWYRTISDEYGLSFEETRAYCKLLFGIPILREKSEKFKRAYDKNLKPLTYREKVFFIMHTDLPVTSTFSTKEMANYMEAMRHFFSEKGIRLKSIRDR